MALLDASAAAKYGLSAAWADRLFNGQTKMGQAKVYYSDTCAYKDTWGNCQTRPAIKDIDVFLTGDSVIQGSGLEVSGSAWFANKPDTNKQFWNIVNNANASNPMNVTGPLRKENNGQWDGPTKPNGSDWPGSFQGISTYLDFSNFTPQKLEYQDTSNTSISNGQIVLNRKGAEASGAGASFTFDFLPKGNPIFTLSYSTANKVTLSTTDGIRTSQSLTDTANFQISDAIKASASGGMKDVAQVGIENTLTISEGWSKAWQGISEVNFSKTLTEEKLDTTTASVTINLNGLDKNDDGTYGYMTQAPIVNGVASTVPQRTVTFEPNKKYKAVITYDAATVQNVIKGNWLVKGNIGSIKDSHGNTVSMTAASALAYADNRSGAEVLGYSPGSLGSLDATGTEVKINGESMASTSLSYNFDVSYYKLPERPKPTDTSQGNAEIFDLSSHDYHDHDYHDGLGYFLALKTKEGERAVVMGSGNKDSIEASPDGNHDFVNYQDSNLTGNNNRDTFTFNRVSEGNNIVAKSGNDIVRASSSQIADLGRGRDTYSTRGGNDHHITTGTGKDTVIVKNLNSSFHIYDFDFMNDRIIAGGKLKGSKIRYEIYNPHELQGSSLIDGAMLSVFLQDNQIGIVSIDRSAPSFAALNSPANLLEAAEILGLNG